MQLSFFPFYIYTILTDNGREFTLKNHKWKNDLIGEFDELCNEINIEHKTTKKLNGRKMHWHN